MELPSENIEVEGGKSRHDDDHLLNVKVRSERAWSYPKVAAPEWLARVAELMLSENLVVLSGLGTSLCLLNADGSRTAPTMTDLWTEVSSLPGSGEVMKQINWEEGATNVEDLMSRCQLSQMLSPKEEIGEFIKAAEKLIKTKCSFAHPEQPLPVHEAFLRKVGRRASRQPRLRLFTTNYDLCFEIAAANVGFVVIDGFGHGAPQVFDGAYFSYDLVRRDTDGEAPTFIPNVFQLFKLHGSVDWVRQAEGRVVRGETEHPAMVYPRIGKFESSYQQPFFEMMSRFQSSLRQPNTGLLIVGYGFNDKHLNEPILAALRSNVGLKCAIVDPALESLSNPVHRAFTELIDGGDVRLSAIAAKFEDFVELLPDLVSLSESELHIERSKRLLNL